MCIRDRHSSMKEWESEFPSKAIIVKATETAVTLPDPKRFVRRSELSEETIVPNETIIKMMPDQDIGTFRSLYMTGQALPSRESGKPREMKAIYMMISKAPIINTSKKNFSYVSTNDTKEL